MKVESAVNLMALEFQTAFKCLLYREAAGQRCMLPSPNQSQPIAHTVVSTSRAQYSRLNLKEINSS